MNSDNPRLEMVLCPADFAELVLPDMTHAERAAMLRAIVAEPNSMIQMHFTEHVDAKTGWVSFTFNRASSLPHHLWARWVREKRVSKMFYDRAEWARAISGRKAGKVPGGGCQVVKFPERGQRRYGETTTKANW